MNNLELKKKRISRRKQHIRKKIHGTPDRLRLSVHKSLNHIYTQIIDDEDGKTLVSASTLDKDVKEQIKPKMKKLEKSKLVGTAIAKKALEKKIKKVAFDRSGFLYHGRIKALADSARESGLEF
ncbi:MAG: 50S ribosomal protein L18 [FCB group bacterium]|jgi:large subunit ribosomal protein L18